MQEGAKIRHLIAALGAGLEFPFFGDILGHFVTLSYVLVRQIASAI